MQFFLMSEFEGSTDGWIGAAEKALSTDGKRDQEGVDEKKVEWVEISSTRLPPAEQ